MWLFEAIKQVHAAGDGPPACSSCHRATALLRGTLWRTCAAETRPSQHPLICFNLCNTFDFSLHATQDVGHSPPVGGRAIAGWAQPEFLKSFSIYQFN